MAIRPLKLKDADAQALDDIASAPTVPVNAGGIPVTPTPAAQSPVKPTQNQVPPNRSQDKKALLAEARKFGEQDGAGKRSHVSFARVLVRGGADGTITATGKSQDASDFYTAFMESSQKASTGVTGAEKNSTSAQLSKVRAFIRLGTKYEDEALKVFDDAKDLHAELVKSEEYGPHVKYRSTYTSLYAIAVAQCKPEQQGVALTADQMKELMLDYKLEKVTTGATVLIQALNLVESAMRGKAETSTHMARDPITHDALPNIVDALRTVIAENDLEALNQRDADIEAIRQKKLEAAAKKAQAAADKAAKDREKAIQDAENGEQVEGDNAEAFEDEGDEIEEEGETE